MSEIDIIAAVFIGFMFILIIASFLTIFVINIIPATISNKDDKNKNLSI